jgi:lipoate-protein ligase A
LQLLLNKNTDIYFNLALEEYLLKYTNDDYIIIWQSGNSLVFGKHQNVFEEINLKHVLENNINIARRISGGGTVYHDFGNINFSFILTKEAGKQVDFKSNTKPIFNYLKNLGLNVNYSKRHDIFIDDNKISGNAEHVYKNRVLHHGTLLFNSNLDLLNKSLKKNTSKFSSKAVKSASSQVTNISDYLENENIDDFINGLQDYLIKNNNAENNFTLNDRYLKEIEKLRNTKFINNSWLYDYSPKFTFKNTIVIDNKEINIELNIEQGIIKKANLFINNVENIMINDIFTKKNYYPKIIKGLIENNNLAKQIGIENNELFYAFF